MAEFWPDQDKKPNDSSAVVKPIRSELAGELCEIFWHTYNTATLCYVGIANLLEKAVWVGRQARLKAVYSQRAAKFLVDVDGPSYTDEELDNWRNSLNKF